MKRNKNKLTIGIICGGPSEERGISLNSARSVLDHLHGDGVEVVPFYLDYKARPYKLKRSQMYSNTPSDFDFKLHNSAVSLSKKEFINELKELDIVLPVLHGTYGEDGTIQQLLEKNNIPYIGSSSLSCRRAFDKYSARSELANNGFVTISAIVLEKKDTTHSKIINTFHRKVSAPRYIVKPARGGSSIGVYSVTTKKEILNAAQNIFDANLDSRVIVEPFIEGTEFTLSILENKYGLPVALIPTEIETSYANNEVFDYRKKYLPTNAARHHTPPRFSKDVIDSIRTQGEHIFALLEMSSFARFDGWVLSDGTVVFTDLNPFNGMEQNSFMFQQGARIGMSHADMLHVLLRVACAKYGLTYPYRKKSLAVEGKNVPVLFGGSTSERQVSVMSGTNAWLKLRGSKKIASTPYLLAKDEKTVWSLPYDFALEHTVEEIEELVHNAKAIRNSAAPYVSIVQRQLGEDPSTYSVDLKLPERQTLMSFIKDNATIFLGLHGGIGESGQLQKKLEKYNVVHNGSGSEASALCMDKWKTNKVITSSRQKGLYALPQKKFSIEKLRRKSQCNTVWELLRKELHTETCIIKPHGDGCSSGVVHLYSADDLWSYMCLLYARTTTALSHTFTKQTAIIEMPNEQPQDVLFEAFVKTDTLEVKNNKLHHKHVTGMVEVTCGVIQNAEGILHAFNPSITVAQGDVLSVEEKFQGGTGVNLTPPPESIMSMKVLDKVKKNIVTAAKALDIAGYARIDAFVDITTGDTYIIEANTLPALTPSTVIYQQALAEKRPMFPRDFLEVIINNVMKNTKRK